MGGYCGRYSLVWFLLSLRSLTSLSRSQYPPGPAPYGHARLLPSSRSLRSPSRIV